MAERLRALVPQVRIRMAYGQMGNPAENVMLTSTTGNSTALMLHHNRMVWIYPGSHLIVYDADYYGLSQPSQGRWQVNRLAYAYLTYRKDKVLSEVAEKRLRAIKEFTEFGAGFKIAMRDLEIRGSGNILGPQQHGHMTAVGYELYCKLLDEEIRRLKGETVQKPMEITIDIRVNAYRRYTFPGRQRSRSTRRLPP